jgi:hypothetical protein
MEASLQAVLTWVVNVMFVKMCSQTIHVASDATKILLPMLNTITTMAS